MQGTSLAALDIFSFLNLNTLDGDEGLWGKPYLLINKELNRSRWEYPRTWGSC